MPIKKLTDAWAQCKDIALRDRDDILYTGKIVALRRLCDENILVTMDINPYPENPNLLTVTYRRTRHRLEPV